MFIHSLVVVYTIQNDGLLKGICIFKVEIWPSLSIGFLIQLEIGSNPNPSLKWILQILQVSKIFIECLVSCLTFQIGPIQKPNCPKITPMIQRKFPILVVSINRASVRRLYYTKL